MESTPDLAANQLVSPPTCIHHEVEQNTDAWLALRTGIPTASAFDKIVTPGGKLSEQCTAYMYQLAAESLVGHTIEFESKYMERGHELEGDAVRAYELQMDVDTLKAGFFTNAAGTIGASPDRLIGDDGILEIKCPAAHTHISYMLKRPVDKKYYPQLQGQLYITERAYVDIVSYYPELPMAIVRVERDEEFIALLHLALTSFCLRLKACKEELQQSLKKEEVANAA
jgi:hypothetical protein